VSKTSVANWGNYPVVEAEKLSFKTVRELCEMTRSGSFIARGNGACYGDASLNAQTILSTLKFDNILQFDEQKGIITCQTGITFDTLLNFLIPKGWFLPVTPGTKYITLGGAVASDIHGKNHHVDGSFGNHILNMELLLASGEVVSCNKENNPDLFMATCGGMGLTGVVLVVTFRLKKIETAYINQVSIKARNLDEIFDLFEKYKDTTYSVAWIDCLQGGSSLGRSLLMVGEHAKRADTNVTELLRYIGSEQKLSVPITFPNFVLNKYSIKLFNFFFYYKQFKKIQKSIVTFDKFFYPLDFIKKWNRMYGNRGFVQYQFVLPLENSRVGLHKILEEINQQGMGSFLAVLKLFGESEGLMSFPMKGYTLALDFPIRDGLFDFLDKLDKIVLQQGGRIYLTKDARMKKEMFWQTYPNVEKFKNILKKYNPDFKWKSLQSDRLQIS
jgi:decaprenylphospho-beta-D-ribofuranose 2-oxidase